MPNAARRKTVIYRGMAVGTQVAHLSFINFEIQTVFLLCEVFYDKYEWG